MKKKLISILLLVVIFATLIPTAAFAEPAVAIYTLGAGDTVSSLCARHGVDYNTYKVLIMALNNVSNEYDFARMSVGSRIVIPVSAQAAATISGIKTAGVISGTAGVTTGTTAGGVVSGTGSSNSAVGAAKNVAVGDTVNCYVISYTIKSGDTVIGIYNTRELNYKTFSNLILKLNKLSNVNNLKVGQKLLLPVSRILPGDEVVYTIMNHPMKSGETVYGVVTGSYGMDYKANTELLKTVNNKDNLGAFRVGEVLRIAVNGYIPSTNTSTNTGTSTTVISPMATARPVTGTTNYVVTPSYPSSSGGGTIVVR